LPDRPLYDEGEQDEDVAAYSEDDADTETDNDTNTLPHFEGHRDALADRHIATRDGSVDGPIGAVEIASDFAPANGQIRRYVIAMLN